MRIAVIGAGAVGGYFGGRLAQAGHDVLFVARGETLRALRSTGLQVRSVAGDFTLAQPDAVEDPAGQPPADVVLMAVKAPQVKAAAMLAAPLIGPRTVVVPLQNGLEAPGLIADALGRPEGVLGGLCKIFASLSAPAMVEHGGLSPIIEIGELAGSHSERVERIREAFAAAEGMETVVPESIQTAMWQKLLYVEPLGAVGSVARQPAGVLRAVPQSRELVRAAVEEIVQLAHARGIELDPNLPADVLLRIDKLPGGATASMQRDIMAGRPSELEYQTGVIVRFAAESGVAVPVHSTIYAALLPGEIEAGVAHGIAVRHNRLTTASRPTP